MIKKTKKIFFKVFVLSIIFWFFLFYWKINARGAISPVSTWRLDQEWWNNHPNYESRSAYASDEWLRWILFWSWDIDYYYNSEERTYSPYISNWNLNNDFLGFWNIKDARGFYITSDGIDSNLIEITWHILDLDSYATENHCRSTYDDSIWYHDIECSIIFVLNTDYVVLSGQLYSWLPHEFEYKFLAIVSNKNWWTTIYTSGSQDVFFWNSNVKNIILDNVHIDGWYYWPWNPKPESNRAQAVFAWDISYQGQQPKLWGMLWNITINNSTISNMSWYIIPMEASQNNIRIWWILLNNVTTYNNKTTNWHGLFYINAEIEGNFIFNNLKSFDNLNWNQFVIYSRRGWMSINNSYFNPWTNSYDIYIDRWCCWHDRSTILNNVVWNIYSYSNTNAGMYCYAHNIIWSLLWPTPCNLYWYYKYFYPNEWYDNFTQGDHEQNVTSATNRTDWEDSATNLGCLKRNYIVNPFAWSFASPKYTWTSATNWCVTKSVWNTSLTSVSWLYYSFWKDLPTQVTPVKRSWDSIVNLDIPYNNNNQYIASNKTKIDTLELNLKNWDHLISWDARVKVSDGDTYKQADVFWPQINWYVITNINWRSNNISFIWEVWQKAIITQLKAVNTDKYRIHFGTSIQLQNPAPTIPVTPTCEPSDECFKDNISVNCSTTTTDATIRYTTNGNTPNCTNSSTLNGTLQIIEGITLKVIACNGTTPSTTYNTYTYTKDTQWPNKPTLNTPINNGTVNSNRPTLTRETVTNDNGCSSVAWYEIRVCSQQNCEDSSIIRTGSSNTTQRQVTTNLNNWSTYFRQVRAKDALGNPWNWSTVNKFTVNITTLAPTCTANTCFSGSININCSNGDYKMQRTTNWNNPGECWDTNTNRPADGLTFSETTTLKIKSCNGINSSNTVTYTYTKDTQWPNTPTLTSPANGTTIESFTPTLSWNPATDNGCSNTISWYKIIVCTGNGPLQIQCDDSHYLRSETTTSSTSISIPSGILQNWNWYKRKVKAKDGLWNRWDWSDSTFTINIDTAGPTCWRWNPSTNACISWWVAWTITLTCTDDAWIATYSLNSGNITHSWTLFTINSVFTETTPNNTTRRFKVFYTSNTNVSWTWRFILKEKTVRDISNNPASPTSSSQIRVDNQAPSTPSMNQEPEFTSWTNNTVYSYTTTDRGCSPTVQYQFCKSITNNTNSCSSSNISSWLDETSHTFTNLSNQKYFYFVRTRDWLGNIGSWSSSTYSTQDSIKPTITFDKNSGAAAGSHSVVVTVTDTWSKLENNSKIRYKRTTDSTCWWWTYIHTWLSQHIDYATTTITTPSNIANGSYYLCIQWGMTSDNAWNTNNQTKTSWVFIIQLVCEITEASQCRNSQLELTLTANKDIQTPDGRTPKTLGWGWKVDKKIFTQNVTSNNTVSVTITDFSWSTATCSITPTNYDNVWPSFIFNNATWNECTWWQLIITGVNDTWCATWVTNVNIGEKIYKFNGWSWWKSAIYTISAQQPWTITVTWEVRDNLWNISRKTATYTVVNVAPTANNFSTWEIWKTPRNITLSQFITASNAREWDCWTTHLTFSGVKTNGNIWTCSINNSILTYTPQANKQWSDTCKITIKDNENSTIDVTVTFNDIDTVPPTITITNNPTNFNQCTTWKTVTASINETGTILYYTTGGTCSISWPYETWATNTRNFTKSFGSESDMWLYVCFKAIDLAWNEYYKTGTQIIKIDRTAPTFAMSWNFEWNTNNYPELYECETWFAEIINVNDTWCALIPTNAYSWDNWAFGNIKKNNFGNNTTWIKTVDIKVKDNLLNTSGATIKFIWRNRAISFLNTATNTIHLENDMIDVVTINPIDIFWLTWRWTCEAIVITPIYCSGATQTLQWTFPNYTLKIEPDEDLDSSWYCDISFKDCTKGNTTNCDSTLQWHIEFEVKTKDYYVVLDSVPGKSSWHIHNENDFDTGKISLIASKTIGWKPDFSDKYTIKGVTREREETLYHGTQRPDITNINVEIENFRFDDEDFNLCISWNIIVKIDTGFITDPAWNPSKATDITTNQTYELRQHLCASWITDDLLPWDNNKFEKIESTLRNSGFDLILLSTTGLSLWTDSIECIWDPYSCPWFHCRDIWITGSVTNIQTTWCINDSSVYGYTKQYTLHIDPIDDEAFTYHEWPWSWQRRSDWTWCQIKIKDGNCPYAYTNINMHIKMSAYKYWLIGSEDFYDLNLWSAISEWWWDNGFFFYISNPQIINIWWQSWLVWKINYEMYFDSWVADEFYTIQWTGIVNWYQQNLEIKRPTFNYSNPRGYLFNFPYYD